MTDRVDVVDTEDPFVLRELDFSTKVVQMPDQGGEDFSVSGLCLGAHKINNMLREVGVIFAVVLNATAAVGTVGTISAVENHDNVIFLSGFGSEEE